jgi:hypothetical protein
MTGSNVASAADLLAAAEPQCMRHGLSPNIAKPERNTIIRVQN